MPPPSTISIRCRRINKHAFSASKFPDKEGYNCLKVDIGSRNIADFIDASHRGGKSKGLIPIAAIYIRISVEAPFQ